MKTSVWPTLPESILLISLIDFDLLKLQEIIVVQQNHHR